MPTQIKLAIIASVTIFAGLLIAKLPRVSEKRKGFLNAVSTGVLIFLLVEIMGKVIESVEELMEAARGGFPQMTHALTFGALAMVGLAIGLLSMVYFENVYIRGGKDESPEPARKAWRLAFMIALGIGMHNLTEGLAIAQSFSWGNEKLSVFLAIGFALHNATEGFGIAAPLSGLRPSWTRLFWLGLLAGGPTLLGAIIGTYWQSDNLRFLSFGLAAGAILYIIGELMHLGRHLKGEAIVEVGLLVGFALAFATEMAIAALG